MKKRRNRIITRKFLLEAIEEEIRWCNTTGKGFGKSPDSEESFIEGLRQSQRIINQLFGVKVPKELE